MPSSLHRFLLSASLCLSMPAMAYGPDGHHSIGAIADRLLVGSKAATEVAALLGGLRLEDAAVWADCAKGVNEGTLKYVKNARFAECVIHETPEGIAAMEDYVTRNNRQCQPAAGEEICHKGYHYTDIAIQRTAYSSAFIGARPTDLVAAVKATLIVLQGGQPPAPFNFKDKREALLALTHYVGDLHQPLHVGAIYLSSTGRRVNPDAGTYQPATFTRGGNELLIGGDAKAKLHGAWDAVPDALKPANADALATVAKTIPTTVQGLPEWPQLWATETLKEARKAFTGTQFGPKKGLTWSITLPPNYTARMTAIKTERVEKAGARLAQALRVVWPD
jgi:hypothetical protein